MKYLRVQMPDGSKWDVPAQIIAENRARVIAQDVPSQYEPELAFCLNSNEELKYWAANNLNWSDVEKRAVRYHGADAPDYQAGWVNGEKEVVEHQPKETA